MTDVRSRLKWGFGLTALILIVSAAGIALLVVDGRPALLTPFDGGMGTESSPWEISTAGQLVAIDSSDTYLGGSFVLVDDVDFDDVDGREFTGIGSSDRPFTGSFDGGGHTIENFSVHSDERADIGLFQRSNGTIEAVEMIDVYIFAENGSPVGSIVGSNRGKVIDGQASGSVVGSWSVGGLVGSNQGKVIDGQASADVTGGPNVGGLVGVNSEEVVRGNARGDVEGGKNVGGLVGLNQGAVSDGTILEGRARGDVGGKSNVGGLVGSNQGEVIAGKASGDVEGGPDRGLSKGTRVLADGVFRDVEGKSNVGGFVGVNEGRVIDSHAGGDVEGKSNVGGFVGWHINGASVTRAYSSGLVDGEENTGGFVGKADEPGSIEFSYWNTDATGVETSAGGLGLTDGEFTDPERFEGFVFCPAEDCRWVMDDDNRRPVLQSFQ